MRDARDSDVVRAAVSKREGQKEIWYDSDGQVAIGAQAGESSDRNIDTANVCERWTSVIIVDDDTLCIRENITRD